MHGCSGKLPKETHAGNLSTRNAQVSVRAARSGSVIGRAASELVRLIAAAESQTG